MIPVSLQFWSLNKEFSEDFAGTAKKIGQIGYKAIEFGFNTGDPRPAKERHKILSDAGLKVSSMHASVGAMEDQFDEVIDMAKTIGTNYIITPWMPPELFTSVKSCSELGQRFAAIGKKTREAGLLYGYHNHDFDYALLEGRPAMEWVLEAAEPRDVVAQIDVYWVYAAGGDPAKAIARAGARCRTLHIKDGTREPKITTEFGKGKVDLPAVFAEAERHNFVEWYVVEQEAYDCDPFDSLRRNLEYLKKLGKA